MNIEILQEDNHFLFINKPAGVLVHPDGSSLNQTISEWFAGEYPDSLEVGESLRLKSGKETRRPGIVHRLDKDTSGVLVLAKTDKAYKFLKQAFKRRQVSKTYHTFVYGDIERERGEITKTIGRSKDDFRKRATGRHIRGPEREAVTYFYVRRRVRDERENQPASFLEVKPQTGRTHQIRVHLMSIGHPVVSDDLYAPGRPGLLGFERLALHARSLEFQAGDKNYKVGAPYPGDFHEALGLTKAKNK